jgi:hypothetical protein
MSKFILILSILYLITVSSCGDNYQTANTRANSTNTNAVRPTPVETAKTANVQTTNSLPTNSNGQTTSPTPKKDESLFSFPPPRVVDFTEIPSQLLVNSAGQTTFSDVSQKMAAGLENAGYTKGKYAYFWNNDNEFAIVTKLERINPDGTPFNDEIERWEIRNHLPTAHGLSEYFCFYRNE